MCHLFLLRHTLEAVREEVLTGCSDERPWGWGSSAVEAAPGSVPSSAIGTEWKLWPLYAGRPNICIVPLSGPSHHTTDTGHSVALSSRRNAHRHWWKYCSSMKNMEELDKRVCHSDSFWTVPGNTAYWPTQLFSHFDMVGLKGRDGSRWAQVAWFYYRDVIKLKSLGWPISGNISNPWGAMACAWLPWQHWVRHDDKSLSSPLTFEDLPNHTRVHFVPWDGRWKR